MSLETIPAALTCLTPTEMENLLRACADRQTSPARYHGSSSLGDLVLEATEAGDANMAWVTEMGGNLDWFAGPDPECDPHVALIATWATGYDYYLQAEKPWKLYHRILGADDGLD